MKSQKKHTHGGFTLVELLVVIVIIASLVAISVTAVVRFRNSADKTIVLGNLRQLQTANISYSSDHQGSFVPPEAIVVDANGVDTGERVDWYENPDFISQLKGEQATFSTTSGTPDTSLPSSMMDPVVLKQRPANYQNLSASYSYTRLKSQAPMRFSQLNDASRSAAFITADGDGFIDHASKSEIAYRHGDRAVVVYYGGHAAIISEANINSFDNNGGASNIFWDPS